MLSKQVEGREEHAEEKRHQEDDQREEEAAPGDPRRPRGADPAIEIGVNGAKEDDPQDDKESAIDEQGVGFGLGPYGNEFAALKGRVQEGAVGIDAESDQSECEQHRQVHRRPGCNSCQNYPEMESPHRRHLSIERLKSVSSNCRHFPHP